MDLAAFKRSLGEPVPPEELDLALRALWLDARGDWDGALRSARADPGGRGLWVQGYLHRKAGDEREARLWYWRAGVAPAAGSLESEWEDIVQTILAEKPVTAAYGA